MASGKKDKGSRDEGRRDFMKSAVGTLVVGATLVGSRGTAHAQRANQKAVLPDGKAYSRAELLERLGLNPNTPPEAWLSIHTCGSNAGALLPRDAERLREAGKLDRKQQQGLKIQPRQIEGMEGKVEPQ
jgi:hypothetical protein